MLYLAFLDSMSEAAINKQELIGKGFLFSKNLALLVTQNKLIASLVYDP